MLHRLWARNEWESVKEVSKKLQWAVVRSVPDWKRSWLIVFTARCTYVGHFLCAGLVSFPLQKELKATEIQGCCWNVGISWPTFLSLIHLSTATHQVTVLNSFPSLCTFVFTLIHTDAVDNLLHRACCFPFLPPHFCHSHAFSYGFWKRNSEKHH